MMLGRVLLKCLVIISLIYFAGHIILYAGRHLHIPYVHYNMNKGEVCTGKFVFIWAKGNMKAWRVCMQLTTAGRINRV